MSGLTLYGYWRSGPSYRVRIAMALKGLAYRYVGVNLLAGEQTEPDNAARHPLRLVPSLELADGRILTQSPAILEWLDEVYPAVPLLPAEPMARAQIRAMAALIGCDIHPLHNLRILGYLGAEMGHDNESRLLWSRHWISQGFAGLEALLKHTEPGPYCWGDMPSLADIYLIPQVYSARRWGIDMASYPRLAAIEAAALTHPAFAAAHPDQQPDAVK